MQQIGEPTAESSIVIDAPAEEIWAVVADVTRTPEWSPVCHRCEWIDGHREAVVGARFRGFNKLNGARWSRECVVTEAIPGKELAFSTLFKGQESTRWRYRIAPAGSATMVSEAYEVVLMPRWVRLFRRIPGAAAKSDRDTRWNMTTSLERLQTIISS